MMKDSVVHVKDTVAWTLGRICELLIHCIKADVHLNELVSALVYGLQDSPRIVGNCCWVSLLAIEMFKSNSNPIHSH